MDLLSYENLEKIIFPKNINQKVVGCVLLLIITNGIIFASLRELTRGLVFQSKRGQFFIIEKRRLKPARSRD